MPTFTHTTVLPHARADVFAWFERPGAFVRLTPPFAARVIREPSHGIEPGSTAALGMGAPGGLGLWLGAVAGSVAGVLPPRARNLDILHPQLRWEALHTALTPGRSFTDVMTDGPLTSWTHTHTFDDGAEPGTTLMTDIVDYQLPAVAATDGIHRRFEAELARIFAYRERQLAGDLAFHAAHAGRPRTIAVSGASGLIGSQLCALLAGGGHRVLRLVRRPPSTPDEVFWDPARGVLDPAALAGCDVVVNLAGHGIGGRFTAKTKDAIYRSRIEGTALLARTLASLADDGVPRGLVSGSAVGYYGATPHGATGTAAQQHVEPLTEAAPAGNDFLAHVCHDWEVSCTPAAEAGVRVVTVRTGIVLSPGGGVLQRFLPLYLAGVGGPLGRDQWQSWIGIDDIAGIFAHAALSPAGSAAALHGPVNGVAPHPVTAAGFAHTLAGVLHRPAAVKVPALGPRLLLGGQGAQELALADQRISSAKIEAAGYQFRHRSLELALRHVLGAQG